MLMVLCVLSLPFYICILIGLESFNGIKKICKEIECGQTLSDALLDEKFGLVLHFTVSVTTVLIAEGKMLQ